MKKLKTYTQPICEVVSVALLVNNSDGPNYGDNEGTTGIVAASTEGKSASMAQTNEYDLFEQEPSTAAPNLWDE